MKEFMDAVLPYILDGFGTLLLALLSFAGYKLADLLNKRTKNEHVQNLVNGIYNVAANAAKVTYQTYVESIKGTEAWNTDSQKYALNMAVEIAKAQLTEDAKNFITTNCGDLTEYLSTAIESSIYTLKNGATE